MVAAMPACFVSSRTSNPPPPEPVVNDPPPEPQPDPQPDPETAADRVGPVLDAVAEVRADHPDMYIAQGGDASGDKLIGDSLDRDLERLSLLSLPSTLGILIVAFGAVLAAVRAAKRSWLADAITAELDGAERRTLAEAAELIGRLVDT